MHLVTTVTEENRIAIGLRREAHGDVERAQMAHLSPMEARAYASQIVRSAEIAERRLRASANGTVTTPDASNQAPASSRRIAR